MAAAKVKKATKTTTNGSPEGSDLVGDITSTADLKSFLLSLRDRMTEGQAAPIYAFSAMNLLLSRGEIYSLFDNETKELGRDIWLRLKQAGVQVRNPVFLFGQDATDGAAA